MHGSLMLVWSQVARGSAPPTTPSLHSSPFSSPPSNSHISRVRSAPDWPPRMPLNGGGLGKHFKRKPKSVSHLPRRPSLLSLFLSHTHTAVIWLFKFSAAFLQLELVYDIPSADSLASPPPPPLSRSSSLRRAHTNTTQSHFFLLCSFSSLCLQCLLFLTFPCRRCRCVLHHLVCLEAMKEQSHTHAHRPCVSSLWGGWGRGLVEERGGGEVKGSIS